MKFARSSFSVVDLPELPGEGGEPGVLGGDARVLLSYPGVLVRDP